MKLYANVIGRSGKPLLILHGLFGMGDNWKTLGKRFSEEYGFQVHLIDLRNHGRSPHTEEFNYTVMAQDIQEYCQNQNFDKIVLIGHSMGGKTAMHFAVNSPELLEALVVVDIAPKYYPPHHQTILKGLNALQEQNFSSRRKADKVLQNYIDNQGIRQFLLKNLYWKEKGKLALRMNLPVIEHYIDEVGKAIAEKQYYNKATLFVKGQNSAYIQREDRALLKKHFPKSQLLSIKNADHWVHAEKPDEFFDGVVGFLKFNQLLE